MMQHRGERSRTSHMGRVACCLRLACFARPPKSTFPPMYPPLTLGGVYCVYISRKHAHVEGQVYGRHGRMHGRMGQVAVAHEVVRRKAVFGVAVPKAEPESKCAYEFLDLYPLWNSHLLRVKSNKKNKQQRDPTRTSTRNPPTRGPTPTHDPAPATGTGPLSWPLSIINRPVNCDIERSS